MSSNNEYSFHKLFTDFHLWYHNPNDNGWSIENYTKLIEINTIEDYWYYTGFINDKMVCFGMLFLMKNNIQPIWEDTHNINGGYISIKLSREKTMEKWKNILIHFVSGNLTDNINGISISPKKHFNIIKIWFNEEIDIETYKFPETLCIEDKPVIFRAHKNNIQKNINSN